MMGIISETAHMFTAHALEIVLRQAIISRESSDEVFLFCKRYLYPVYESEIAEAFEKMPDDIKILFRNDS